MNPNNDHALGRQLWVMNAQRVQERLRRMLVILANFQAYAGEKADLPLTHDELALLINTDRATVSRCLKRLERGVCAVGLPVGDSFGRLCGRSSRREFPDPASAGEPLSARGPVALPPKGADRLRIAREIRRQEKRILTPEGIVIHSDAAGLVG